MDREGLISTRTMELVIAGILMVIGGVVMWDSWRLGAGWDSNGPQSGYFPFYIGALILISSTGVFAVAIVSTVKSAFVEHDQFRMVLQVFVPSAVYCGLIAVLGIYVASAVFIAYFMVWMDDYPVLTTAAVSLGVPAFLFALFEIWFLVPLPKGPIEEFFGY
jgi:hypothetical protein